MQIWIVKRLRDLRSGRPEADVSLFRDEDAARTCVEEFIGQGFEPWPPGELEPGERPMAWAFGDPSHPDEYLELERKDLS